MAKGNNKGKGNTGTTTAATPAAAGPVVQVTAAAPNFRAGSARAAYYMAIVAHAGQPVSVVAAAIAASPPSQPKRGKLAGQTEPFAGWLGWFVRHGYLTLQG